MRIVFLGSPEEVISPLAALLNECRQGKHELLGIVSQPARPQGRKQVLTDPPVASYAKAQGLRTWQPEKASDPQFLAELRELDPDLFITAAYGQILTSSFLAIPKRATINIHPSLLPHYRGATPVPAALLAGEKETGISILFTIRELDAGNIILQRRFPIESNETSGQLTTRLFHESGSLLIEAIDRLSEPSFQGIPQESKLASFCKKINKLDGRIDWSKTSEQLINEFKAFHPWPGSFCFLSDQRILLEEMRQPLEAFPSLMPGHFILSKETQALLVGTGTSPLAITKLKPAGSQIQTALAFWNGLRKVEGGFFT